MTTSNSKSAVLLGINILPLTPSAPFGPSGPSKPRFLNFILLKIPQNLHKNNNNQGSPN